MKHGNLIVTDDEMGCVVKPWIKSTTLHSVDASTFIPTIIIIPFMVIIITSAYDGN